MNGGSKREREERAFDALLVSILRRVDKDDDIVEPDKLPKLTDEEKAAMNALGTDFIDRILAGERPIPPKEDPRKDNPGDVGEAALAGSADCSLNRAEEVDDETTEELERREREILERKAREQGERGAGAS